MNNNYLNIHNITKNTAYSEEVNKHSRKIDIYINLESDSINMQAIENFIKKMNSKIKEFDPIINKKLSEEIESKNKQNKESFTDEEIINKIKNIKITSKQ